MSLTENPMSNTPEPAPDAAAPDDAPIPPYKPRPRGPKFRSVTVLKRHTEEGRQRAREVSRLWYIKHREEKLQRERLKRKMKRQEDMRLKQQMQPMEK